MKLIFIRHADPDYAHNTITKKGRREAELLANRSATWKNICGVFVSPYGRAQDTAQPLLERLGIKAETLPWLREFDHHIIDSATKEERFVCWDWLPRAYFAESLHFDAENWHKTETFLAAGIGKYYNEVCTGLDAILARYGYNKKKIGAIYACPPHLSLEEAAKDTHLEQRQKDLDARNLVFVCHLGVMFAAISYLTHISPMQLWQGFFVAPSSVTVLGAEERCPGEVVFRVQCLGDVRHLSEAGEPPSCSGFYGNVEGF